MAGLVRKAGQHHVFKLQRLCRNRAADAGLACPNRLVQLMSSDCIRGKRYLDAISSWWTNLFGHANPSISGAVAAQALQLEHVMLAALRTSRPSNWPSAWCAWPRLGSVAASLPTTARLRSKSR